MNAMKTHIYAVADSKGQISWVTTGPYLYIKCDDSIRDDTHYVDIATQEIKPKMPLEPQLSVEDLTVTLTGLPPDLTVSTNGLEGITDTTPLVITYDVPGTYEVILRGLPEHLDTTLEVTVGDP